MRQPIVLLPLLASLDEHVERVESARHKAMYPVAVALTSHIVAVEDRHKGYQRATRPGKPELRITDTLSFHVTIGIVVHLRDPLRDAAMREVVVMTPQKAVRPLRCEILMFALASVACRPPPE